MKKLVFVLALVLLLTYGFRLQACDCDTAAALTHGMQDRLHQPWAGDQKQPEQKVRNPKRGDNVLKQESEPSRPTAQSPRDEDR